MSTTSRSAGRRLSAITIDQAIAGASNILILLLAAHVLDVASFGRFGIVFLVYVVMQGISRALISEPLLIHPDDARERPGDALGANLVLGLCLGALLVAVSALTGNGDFRNALLVLAPCLPLLMVQDLGRYIGFATRRPSQALVVDILWLVLLLVAIAALVLRGADDLIWFVLAWAGSGAVAGLVVFHQTRHHRARPGVTWIREQWSYSWRYLVSYTSTQVSTLVGAILLGVFAGARALGGVRGALLLMRPVGAFQIAAISAGVAEVSHDRPDGPALRRFAGRTSALTTAAALVNLVVLLVLPTALGKLVLGDTWVEADPLLLPAGLQFVFVALLSGARACLLGARAVRKTVVIDVVSIVVLLGLGLVGVLADGASGSLWAVAFGQLGVAVTFWIVFWVHTSTTVSYEEPGAVAVPPVADPVGSTVGDPAAAEALSLEPQPIRPKV